MYLAGVLTALLLYLKFKDPDVVNVQGDQVNDPKIKDNRKIKKKSPFVIRSRQAARQMRKDERKRERQLKRDLRKLK